VVQEQFRAVIRCETEQCCSASVVTADRISSRLGKERCKPCLTLCVWHVMARRKHSAAATTLFLLQSTASCTPGGLLVLS
jgi:hypothetical protein